MDALKGKPGRWGLEGWLAASAAVLVILLMVQAARYVGARDMRDLATQSSEGSAAAAERADVRPVEEYALITEKGHFGKEKQKKPQLFGILGEVAFIGDSAKDAKPHSVGADIGGGYKLVEIQLNSVVIEKDGEEETLTLFPDLAGGQPPQQRGSPGKEPPPQDRRRRGDTGK